MCFNTEESLREKTPPEAVIPGLLVSKIKLLTIRESYDFLAECISLSLLPVIVKYSDESKPTIRKSIQGQRSCMQLSTSHTKYTSALDTLASQPCIPKMCALCVWVCVRFFGYTPLPKPPPSSLAFAIWICWSLSVYGPTLTSAVLLPPLDNFTARPLLGSDWQSGTDYQPLALSCLAAHITWCWLVPCEEYVCFKADKRRRPDRATAGCVVSGRGGKLLRASALLQQLSTSSFSGTRLEYFFLF